jgi:multidrug resistance efflux pump
MSENQNTKTSEDEKTAPGAATDPVRRWTLIVFGLAIVLMFYYIAADRLTPFTSQARVHALVVPIAAEVSGTVINVAVSSNQAVKEGDVLFQIDRERYQLAVETAEASLQSARQATGASSANVDAAEAGVVSARAGLLQAEQDATRLQRIKEEDPGAISERRVEIAEASFSAMKGQLQAAIANLERAKQDFGEEGETNSRILQAQAALDQAVINLDRTLVRAPDSGIVTDVRVNRGNFAQAGAPLMTFLASNNIWLQADFTENNLGNIIEGDPVEIVFDALPGRVLKGQVRTTGFGVQVDSAPLGSLPTIDNNRQWLRDAQRFAVQIDFDLPHEKDQLAIRVGAQATAVVYADSGFLFNTIAKIKIRVNSILTYIF